MLEQAWGEHCAYQHIFFLINLFLPEFRQLVFTLISYEWGVGPRSLIFSSVFILPDNSRKSLEWFASIVVCFSAFWGGEVRGGLSYWSPSKRTLSFWGFPLFLMLMSRVTDFLLSVLLLCLVHRISSSHFFPLSSRIPWAHVKPETIGFCLTRLPLLFFKNATVVSHCLLDKPLGFPSSSRISNKILGAVSKAFSSVFLSPPWLLPAW